MSHIQPVVVLNPHGGMQIPPEVAGRIALTESQIFNESDAAADDLYDFGDRVLAYETFPIARSIIDVNRPIDRPYRSRTGDGAIKLQTSYGAPVYHPGQEPDADLRQHLIETYWRPWHNKLAQIAADPRVKLVIDGHTMAALGPTHYNDPNALRPRCLVGNFGDLSGMTLRGQRPVTASTQLTLLLAEQLGSRLATLQALADVGNPSEINYPFRGGYQLQEHGGKYQPWLMIEINRALYIGDQTGDSPSVIPDATMVAAIREVMWEAIEAVLAHMQTQG